MIKTKLTEKAKKFVDDLIQCEGLDCSAMMHRSIESRIIKLLAEQDRDTRHACAEAVGCCFDAGFSNGYKLIVADDADRAIMNCSGGIK